jgi:hypothetical protein
MGGALEHHVYDRVVASFITIPRGQYATREFICRAGFICHVTSQLIKAPELIIAPMNAR